MKFRLTTVLYLFALTATALGAFGASGFAFAAAVVCFWIYAFRIPQSDLPWFITAVTIVGAPISVMLPAVQAARESAIRTTCVGKLYYVAHALKTYDNTAGKLPPIVLMNSANTPQHSWRTAILPYTDDISLHQAIDYTQPWDSTANAQHTSSIVDVYQCPSCRSSLASITNYFAVIGERTMWPTEGSRSLKNVPDGAATTILLMEASPAVPWAKPEDLTFDEALKLLTSQVVPDENGGHAINDGYFYKPRTVRNVAMADGSVYGLPGNLPVETATGLLTADGGEKIDINEVTKLAGPQLDEAKVACLCLFVLTALFPGLRISKWRAAGDA
ncbi:MAG: DUF1559 domain-containing protein [Planctomycetota bacterium]